VGDPVEPDAQRPVGPEGVGLAGQDKEGGLENVVGVVGVGEMSAADAEYERAVPTDEDRERGRFARGDEPRHELGVGEGG
jgi:hypothetical protein